MGRATLGSAVPHLLGLAVVVRHRGRHPDAGMTHSLSLLVWALFCLSGPTVPSAWINRGGVDFHPNTHSRPRTALRLPLHPANRRGRMRRSMGSATEHTSRAASTGQTGSRQLVFGPSETAARSRNGQRSARVTMRERPPVAVEASLQACRSGCEGWCVLPLARPPDCRRLVASGSSGGEYPASQGTPRSQSLVRRQKCSRVADYRQGGDRSGRAGRRRESDRTSLAAGHAGWKIGRAPLMRSPLTTTLSITPRTQPIIGSTPRRSD